MQLLRYRTPSRRIIVVLDNARYLLMAANKGATFAVPAGARLPMLNGGDGPLSGRAN
jgi:hypothetical protein